MRKQEISIFIKKTWQMLQEEQNWGIVRWTESGSSFQILNQSLFTQIILPKYFKHSNLSSFLRQLNMYNFQRRKLLQSRVQFVHKLFRKNYFFLLVGIKRRPSEDDNALAQQLLKKLAPECLKHTTQKEVQGSIEADRVISEVTQIHSSSQNIHQQKPYFSTNNTTWIFTPFFIPNLYQMQWAFQNLSVTNLNVPSFPVENIQGISYFFTL